jgi:regulator of cell morphogenesis and NO signaling
MEDSNILLCAPLQQLMNEHVDLRKDMNSFYDITEEIEYESGSEVIQLFQKLYEKILVFNEKLKAHSIREEEGLFPLMALHLGEEDTTIEVMEREHEKAERHLQEFLAEAKKVFHALTEEDVEYITVYAHQAYTTLNEHFAKEEKMLFPLAEKILTAEEKMELQQLLCNLP